MHKKKYLNWENVSKLYCSWLVNNQIKKFFLKKIFFKGFSLWWITDLANKDNVVQNEWFFNLKRVLIDNKIISFNYIYTFITFLKIIKSFFSSLLYFFLFKILLPKKKISKKYVNCFHTYESNFKIDKKYIYIDRIFSNAPFKKNIKQNFYLISLTDKKKFFLNFLEKKNNLNSQKIDYFFVDSYLSFGDIIFVYLNSIINLYKIIFFLKDKKNLFYINNKNCYNVLYPLLINSFNGNIQTYILQAVAIKKFFKLTKAKYFLNYGEFNPGYKSIYFFLKKLDFEVKVITIQHSYANKNLLFFRNDKKEYGNKLNSKNISPMPDKYLVMGNHYKKLLKSYFPNQINIIGALKYDLNYFKQKKKKEKSLKNKTAKILICPTIGDEDSIISIINKSNVKNVTYILSPHPLFFDNTIKKFKKNFNFSFIYDKKISSIKYLQYADLTICGFSSLALESIVCGVPAFRIISDHFPHFFDLNDGIDFVDNHYKFEKLCKNFLNKKNKNQSKVIKNIFYKLDNKAHKRFWDNIY